MFYYVNPLAGPPPPGPPPAGIFPYPPHTFVPPPPVPMAPSPAQEGEEAMDTTEQGGVVEEAVQVDEGCEEEAENPGETPKDREEDPAQVLDFI